MKEEAYFPLFISLARKKIVVIGAGVIAARRVKVLLQFTENIKIIAPFACDEIKNYANQDMIDIEYRNFKEEDIEGAFLVLAATDNKAVNDRVCSLCNEHSIFVNHAGNKEKSDFYFPGIIKKEQVVVGVTASGSNHRLAKEVTDLIKKSW